MSCCTRPDQVAESRDFAARLLSGMGLSAALVAATSGCGGLVVFVEDGDDGSGGSGAGDTTASGHGGDGLGGFGGDPTGGSGVGGGSGGSGGSGGGFPCEVPLLDHQDLVYQCIFKDNGVCPAPGSQETHAQLSDYLSWESCDKLCCQSQSVDYVACGPDPSVEGDCCYLAVVGYYEECMGRPFTVLGEARKADLARRADWCAPAQQAPVEVDAVARRHLARAFSESAMLEHASVASFARFALDLLSLGAPSTLLRATQRAIADEIRHAELCFALASRYADCPVGPGALDCHGEPAGHRTAQRILADTIREGCFGETIAALLAARAAEQAQDPAVRAALIEIADDEARHAELSWQFIAWAHARDLPGWREVIARTFREHAVSTPTAAVPIGVDPALWRAHGQLDQQETEQVVLAARIHVIQTCARALLTAPEPAVSVADTAASA